MLLTEIYADGDGETHFRRTEIGFEMREFAPPSMPVHVSKDFSTTSSLFMMAPPGWDKEYHPTPRRQLCIMLRGALSVRATDGETVHFGPGDILLVNDAASKGHLSQILGKEDATFLFVGLEADIPP